MGALPRLILAAALLATSCESVGRDFPSQRLAELRPGETTEAEVRQWFGEPYKLTQHRGAHPSDIAWYRHAEGSMDGGEGRVLAVELRRGFVHGWLFDSSMAADSTAFSAARRYELVVGESTGDDALERFGPPSGRCRLPSNLAAQQLEDPLPPEAAEVWLWRHTAIGRNLIFLRSRTRVLALAFDRAGRLAALEYRGPEE